MNNFSHINPTVISLAQRIAAQEKRTLWPELELCGFTAETAPILFSPADDQLGLYEIPTHVGQVIYRTDNRAPLGVVGQRYAIAQNRDLVTALAEGCEAALPARDLQGMQLREHTSGGGRFCRMDYTFPALGADIKQLTGQSTSLMFRVSVSNGFGGAPIRGMAGAIDAWCTNGMTIGEFETSTFRHTTGFSPAKVKDFVELEAARFLERVRIWQRWALKEIRPAEAEIALEAAGMSGRRVKQMMEQLEIEADFRGMTVWALYSALTFYSSHNSERFTVRGSGQSDNVAETLDRREQEITRLIETEAFQRLAA